MLPLVGSSAVALLLSTGAPVAPSSAAGPSRLAHVRMDAAGAPRPTATEAAMANEQAAQRSAPPGKLQQETGVGFSWATDDQGMSVGELNQRASQDLVGTGVKKAVQERNRPQNIRPNSPELAKHPATADTGHQQYNPLAWATNAGGLPVPGEHLRVESGKPDFGNEVFGWATASGGLPPKNAMLNANSRYVRQEPTNRPVLARPTRSGAESQWQMPTGQPVQQVAQPGRHEVVSGQAQPAPDPAPAAPAAAAQSPAASASAPSASASATSAQAAFEARVAEARAMCDTTINLSAKQLAQAAMEDYFSGRINEEELRRRKDAISMAEPSPQQAALADLETAYAAYVNAAGAAEDAAAWANEAAGRVDAALRAIEQQ